MATFNGATVESASVLPGEFAWIKSVVSSLGNDATKLAYADWLDERADPRAGFLRQFVAADGAALQSANSFPLSWRNLIGATLVELITKGMSRGWSDDPAARALWELEEWKSTLLAAALPIIGVTTTRADEAKIAVGASRFGGCPDLPTEAAWPAWKFGPMAFLGQFNLADFSTLQAGAQLPSSGLLSLFMGKVIFSPANSTLQRRRPPSDLNDLDRYPACSLNIFESLRLPSPDLFPCNPDQQLRLRPVRILNEYLLKTGQSLYDPKADPQQQARFLQANHYLLGHGGDKDILDSTCTTDKDSNALPVRDPSNWVHLITFGCDENLSWESWVDAGNGAVFLIRDSDLFSNTFDDIRGGWAG